MAFTNTFDVTFPPDTQAANQLGLDIRNLKLDLQQRMGATSGLSTGLPNIGADAQPTNWTGLLFFATDTGAIYQWSGSAWVAVTNNLFSPNRPTVTTKLGTGAGSYSITSTSLVAIDSGNLALSILVPISRTLLVMLTCNAATTSGSLGNVAINDSIAGVLQSTLVQTSSGPTSLAATITGDGNTHLIQAQANCSNGGGSIVIMNLTSVVGLIHNAPNALPTLIGILF